MSAAALYCERTVASAGLVLAAAFFVGGYFWRGTGIVLIGAGATLFLA